MKDDFDEENLEVEKSKVFGKIVSDQTRRIDILGAENKLDCKKCIQEIKRLPKQNPKGKKIKKSNIHFNYHFR